MRVPSSGDAASYACYIMVVTGLKKDLIERARCRRSWVVRVDRLDNQSGEDLSSQTTAEERLAMMWPLALDAWRLSGRRLAEYSRAEIPVRILADASREGSAGS